MLLLEFVNNAASLWTLVEVILKGRGLGSAAPQDAGWKAKLLLESAGFSSGGSDYCCWETLCFSLGSRMYCNR
jgi:hypothetical protein